MAVRMGHSMHLQVIHTQQNGLSDSSHPCHVLLTCQGSHVKRSDNDCTYSMLRWLQSRNDQVVGLRKSIPLGTSSPGRGRYSLQTSYHSLTSFIYGVMSSDIRTVMICKHMHLHVHYVYYFIVK